MDGASKRGVAQKLLVSSGVAQNCASKFWVTILLRDPLTIPDEDEEKANVDNFHFHWYDKLWLYPIFMIMDSFTDPDDHDVEQVPYKTIKKFDVSWDDPGLGLYYAKYPYFEGLWGKTLPQR